MTGVPASGGIASAVGFPEGFFWGVASSAYQVEGAVDEAGRGPSIWDTFTKSPGNIHRGDDGNITCDQYHRFESDFDLMVDLSLRACRFSIAWPRIQPTGAGPANPRGLDHYLRVVEALLQREIMPLVTLYHWDLPQALEDRGGWLNRETCDRFVEYAGLVFERLGDLVPYWMTINEPSLAAWRGYASGRHAPGRASVQAAFAASHHMLLAHGRAVKTLRSTANAQVELGIGLHLPPVRAATNSVADATAAGRVDGISNRWYLDSIFRANYPQDVIDAYRDRVSFDFIRAEDLDDISQRLDYLGVQYYTPFVIASTQPDGGTGELLHAGAAMVTPAGAETTATGWLVEPKALTEILIRIRDDYGPLPLIVSETGCAANDYVDPEGRINDEDRIRFLARHIAAMSDAIAAGVDLRGCTIWSLLDNFEWAEGFSKRFGLVYVEYRSQTRIIKRSGHWLRDFVDALSDT